MKLKLLSLFSIISSLLFGQTKRVGETTKIYIDSLRNNRVIKTEIWYPTNDIDPNGIRKTELPFLLESTIKDATITGNKHSIVFLSHGTGGNRFGLAWLAIALAKNGFIVIAIDHFGNTFDTIIPEYFARYWDRPLDISFTLTKILEDNDLKKYIDPEKIAIAGFSFGGYTSLALAGANIDCEILKEKVNTSEGKKEFTADLAKLTNEIDCSKVATSFKDKRIKAFIAMSPAIGLGFDSEKQIDITDPVLIIGAGNDKITPLKTNAQRYHKLIRTSTYFKIRGNVSHYIFLPKRKKYDQSEKIFYEDAAGINREEIHKKIENKAIHFFNKAL